MSSNFAAWPETARPIAYWVEALSKSEDHDALWAEIVGERTAAHTRAVDIADGVLVIEADHAAWRQELSLLFPAIIEKYNARHGEGTVREIRWRRGGTR